MKKSDIVITETTKIERSIGFSCDHCYHIEVVKVEGQDQLNRDKLEFLPDGWSILSTAIGLGRLDRGLICERHKLTVERPKP